MSKSPTVIPIALVEGDGAAPEMMKAACRVAEKAASFDGIKIEWEKTPMGWKAFEDFGDTLPARSLERALALKLIFFGGVGDPAKDKTHGVTHPHMMPEPRALLTLRKKLGLLLNFRPMIYHKPLDFLARVKPEAIPAEGIQQIWIRFLLEDSYFGDVWLMEAFPDIAMQLGVKPKDQVTGKEERVVNIAYYTREMVIKYIRAAFKEARARKLPVISVGKWNVMSRYTFWQKIVTEIGATEFADVEIRHQLVDSAIELLFSPAKLHGVIACGNEHGDLASDGAAGALGSLGLMCSSAINPDDGAAMFESGAGTAPTLAGKDEANPLGRILTAAMMLRHIGAARGADAIEKSVQKVLSLGYRTGDLVPVEYQSGLTRVGTQEMGETVVQFLGLN
jgi:3-isopropylmalate dehydrogenase